MGDPILVSLKFAEDNLLIRTLGLDTYLHLKKGKPAEIWKV